MTLRGFRSAGVISMLVAAGACLPWQAGQATRGHVLTIEHVALIDGSGSPVAFDFSIVIEGNRIVTIGPSTNVSSRGTVIDARGMYAIPGLWDMHVHMAGVEDLLIPRMLAAGVTSVRDMGGGCTRLRSIRDSIRAGQKRGPRILMAGRILESEQELATHARIRRRADSLGIQRVETAEPGCDRIVVRSAADAGAAIDSILAAGGDFVKARSYADSSVYFAIAREATSRNLTFAAHPPYSINAVKSASAGTTTLEHGFYPWPPSSITPEQRREMLQRWQQAGTQLVPTFITWESRAVHLDSVRAEINDTTGAHGERRMQLPRAIENRWRSLLASRVADGRENIESWRKVLDDHMRDIGDMYRSGIRVLPGTDSPNNPLVYPGISLIDELELFVRGAGLTPMQAIQAATLHPAEAMGVDSLGTLAPGKLADIVLLAADPTIDIRNLRRVVWTITNGTIWRAEKLRSQP